ncbi:uncharacterized protein DUF1992 [Jatrophihabitans sp. GAS493]|uniref:DnaJ family domain-containing protein n=1 Tax=Jatrophihabitans sp. GAS493 TaxID=1907575 RepID=UPI000BB7D529|nr:DUF1992 domain-containing protein [Jatrophihabitans sp. GAS493]SOD75163.1 uncharacterized protein DUF1992 [Jatrophihabitans sp. GAS493]
MTERKPKNVSVGNWVEGQIIRAQRRGDFDDLPGEGKPLPPLELGGDDMSWIAAKLRKENLPVAAVLPPSLALAKEVEDLPALMQRQHGERDVRAHLEDLNLRILQAHRRPQEGPPLRVMTLDIDEFVADWRRRRDAAAAQRAVAAAAAAQLVSARSEHSDLAGPRWRPGWFRRRSSREPRQ